MQSMKRKHKWSVSALPLIFWNCLCPPLHGWRAMKWNKPSEGRGVSSCYSTEHAYHRETALSVYLREHLHCMYKHVPLVSTNSKEEKGNRPRMGQAGWSQSIQHCRSPQSRCGAAYTALSSSWEFLLKPQTWDPSQELRLPAWLQHIWLAEKEYDTIWGSVTSPPLSSLCSVANTDEHDRHWGTGL